MYYYQNEQPIILREYGKSLQNMVFKCMEIKDRDRRTQAAHMIIDIMSKITPQEKKAEDYHQKLWDHLFFISDFKLDVDAPYPMVERELIVPKPEKFHYPQRINRHRHYGKYIVEFIDHAGKMEDQKKRVVAHHIASFMKLVHKTWNNEVVNDEIVKNDLTNISKGNLEMPQDESIKQLVSIKNTKNTFNKNNKNTFNKNKKQGNSQGNNKPTFNKNKRK
jgi:hypothetical protein